MKLKHGEEGNRRGEMLNQIGWIMETMHHKSKK
jgi:hypothetical protein